MSFKILLPLCLLLPALPFQAPASAEREAVMATVRQLFDGMRAGDGAAVRSAFHPQAQLVTALSGDGNGTVQIDALEKFVAAVSSPHAEVWDERISNEVVQIDGTLAVVWTDYAFYTGERLSHCGVDAFQLVKVGGTWQIVSIADTRRKEGCGK